MARDFLMSYVDSEALVRENAECKELLLEAMKYHLLPEQRSALTTERTVERRPEGMRPYLFAVGTCMCRPLRLCNTPSKNVCSPSAAPVVFIRACWFYRQ